MGREPHWRGLEGRSASEKTTTYFDSTTDHTVSRAWPEVKRTFVRQGFDVAFETNNHPGLADDPGLERVARSRALRPLLSRILLTFKGVEMLMHRTQAS